MAKKQIYQVTHEDAVNITTGGTLKQRLAALDAAIAAKAPLASPTFTGTPKAPTPSASSNDTSVATTAFVQGLVSSKIAESDAMIYKGTIGTSGTITALPATHSTGWAYKVITAGTYAGKPCEVGDMIICNTDGTAANDAHWDVVQTNIDGAVTGPTSSVDGRVPVFNGASGKNLKDGGVALSSLVQTSRKVIAGNGLSGGGTLGADVTLNVVPGTGLAADAASISHQPKPTAGTDAGGSGAVVTGVTVDSMGHVVGTTKGNITNISGNAGTATKLATARNLKVNAPGVMGTNVAFDGTGDVALSFNDRICFDLSGAVRTASLASLFGDSYFSIGSAITVNTKISTSLSSTTLEGLMDSYNGKAVLYFGEHQFVEVQFIGLSGVTFMTEFNFNGIRYVLAYSETSTSTQEFFIIKNSGLGDEIPTIPTSTWATLSMFVKPGFKFFDVDERIEYTYDGADWLYNEYIDA